MLIDLKRLKLHPGTKERFHLEGPGKDDLLNDIGGRFAGLIRAELIVENTGRAYIGRGKVASRLQLACSRCLSEFIYYVTADLFLTIVEPGFIAENNRYENLILVKGTEIDIREYVLEAIITEIPLVPLCNQGCEGLCPVCGQNRNTFDCKCGQFSPDPRWDKLKEFK